MFEKRINSLKFLKMLKVDGETIEVTSPWGIFAGKAGLFFKKVMKIGAGG